ncbi:MAG: DUF4251 domain-containing protein [Rikenellaceae bacterium]
MRLKRVQLVLSAVIATAISIAVVANITEPIQSSHQTSQTNPKDEAREIREERRAARQAAAEKMVDSLIISKTYQFNPQTIQMQPAGPIRSLMNPNFTLGVWDNHADACLPYIVGVVPPFRNTILNYTINNLSNYSATRTDDGWLIIFESQLFSPSTYTFEIEVNTKFGGATLTLTNPWQNRIEYNGTISQLY